ncbi:MAG: hypothetical protein WAM05_12185, partial [Candidatus Binataceae bacterium]
HQDAHSESKLTRASRYAPTNCWVRKHSLKPVPQILNPFLSGRFQRASRKKLHGQIWELASRDSSLDPPNPFAHRRFSAFSRRAASLTIVRVFARFVHG